MNIPRIFVVVKWYRRKWRWR